MGNSGVIADVQSGLGEPAGELVEIVDSYRTAEWWILGTGAPSYRHHPFEPGREVLEPGERPVLSGTSGERVDGRVVLAFDVELDPRDAVRQACGDVADLVEVEIRGVLSRTFGGKGGKKCKREAERRDSVPEIRAVGPVPGDDRIESAQSVE